MRLNGTLVVGVVLLVLGVVGYFGGIVAPYPGRAFAVTGVMVGIALVAIGSGRADAGGRA